MSCRGILARACPALLLATVLALAPRLPAPAQGLTTEERLDRLERDLSMLQREVYQDAGVPETGPVGAGGAGLEMRMERLEHQVRGLTGQVEDMTNRIDRLSRRLQHIDGNVASGSAAGNGSAASARSFGAAAGAMPSRIPDRARTSSADRLTPPGPAPGTLTPPTPLVPRAADLGRGMPDRAAGASPASGGVLPSGSVLAQYNFAFGLLKEANYSAAERALREFVRRHPKNALAGNAEYWLGETYYARGRYKDAASTFANGYRRYPKGEKAAADLMKLGISLARANQRQNACLAFTQLAHAFPHPSPALAQRASAEKKRLHCGS